jgi:hypothetical protein
MALCDEFLKQSRALARRRGRPSQINLRRATSAAYYAVFHLLIKEAVESMIPAQPPGLRAKASRALPHADLKAVCKGFQGLQHDRLATLLGGPIPPELRRISKTFVDLQEERHAADYDINLKLSQSAVLSSVANAENVFADWQLIRHTDQAKVFLAALVFGKGWNR